MASDLHAIIQEYNEQIESCLIAVENAKNDETQDSVDSLKALGDAARLCHAHTTKLGIAFKPPVSVDAAKTTLQKWFELPVVFVTLYSGILAQEGGDKSDPFVAKVRSQIRSLLQCYKMLLPQLNSAISSSEKKSSDGILQLIGQLWSCCDQLGAISAGDLRQAVAEEIQTCISFAEDAETELKEAEDTIKENSSYYSVFASIRLVIILWNAIIKRRCNDAELSLGAQQLKTVLRKTMCISADLDDLVCELSEDEDVEEALKSLSKQVIDLADTVEKKDQASDSFTQWITTFITNYKAKVL